MSPNELTPVPPLPAASVPVQPSVNEVDRSREVVGLPPKVRVTLVSSVLVSDPAAVNDGAVPPPVALPKYVFAPAFDRTNPNAGVVVGVETVVVNNGERAPAEKLVTVPPPPPPPPPACKMMLSMYQPIAAPPPEIVIRNLLTRLVPVPKLETGITIC